MKQFIITDPCYILPDDVWQDCCQKAFRNELGWREQSEIFDNAVQEQLMKLSGTIAWASSTGIGDWTNKIWGDSEHIIQSEFCADAGMVCVCELTDKTLVAIEDKGGKLGDGIAAIIETDGDIYVDMDRTDKDWTVVRIKDAAGNRFHSDENCYDEGEDDE